MGGEKSAAGGPALAVPPIRTAVVLAAGLGERLHRAGIAVPKPLVQVAGRPLIAHVLEAVAGAGMERAVCLFNERDDEAEHWCRAQRLPLPVKILRRTTPSSMESLFTLAPHAEGERFLCLTVDAIVAPDALRAFVARAADMGDAHVVLAATRFVDDEKPLFIAFDAGGRVTAMGEEAASAGWVTAGFYVFAPEVFAEVERARRVGCDSLRGFLAHLLRRRYRLFAVPVAKTVDVDRPEDIQSAERFVRSGYRE